jgi:cyclophilin family peptidyl-prolyl cis-trans isomerase
MRLIFLAPALFTFAAFSADKGDLLLERFQSACNSVLNQHGLAPGDMKVIEALRSDLHDWNSSNDEIDTLAAELQLTLWIGDNELADELFHLLIATQTDNPAIGLSWSRFALEQPDADEEAIFRELMSLYPTSPEVVLDWATQLDKRNRYSEARNAIDGLDVEERLNPDVIGVYADLLFADNRFDDAIAELDQADATTLITNPAQKALLETKRTKYNSISKKWEEELAIRESEAEMDDLPRIHMITSKGPIILELYEDHAPNTVANFISLSESGYYDGTRFHRVLPKFMVQGGDPISRDKTSTQAGTGGPGYTIVDEHTTEDIRNHFAGSLSMAKTSAPNSGGSQFFLTHLPTSHLDGRHTVFGRILDGLEIARAIEKGDEIFTVTVIRKRGHEYLPEKLGPNGQPLIESTLEDLTDTSETVKPILDKSRKPSLNSSSNQ